MSFQHLVRVGGARYRRAPPPPLTAPLHHLMQADWPGNVRELRNAAERYVLLGESCGYDIDRLLGRESGNLAVTLPEPLECSERSLIE